MIKINILGYASLDHSYYMRKFMGLGRTTIVDSLNSHIEPGGIARIFEGFHGKYECSAISWVGEDEPSSVWTSFLKGLKVDTTEVVAIKGSAPRCFLFHGRNGDTLTFFDPGVNQDSDLQLSDSAKEEISHAKVMIFAVGPRSATEAALDLLPRDAIVAWIVKADPAAYPQQLRLKLQQRSDLIIHSFSERSYVSLDAKQRVTIVVETSGSGPISWRSNSESGIFLPRPIDGLVNSTGAGDIFSGFVISNWLESNNISQAIKIGADASYDYLSRRRIKVVE
jgi:sugar/nucleoside kinase (ribokinase family)